MHYDRRIGEYLIKALHSRAEVYNLIGKYDEAIKDYEKLIKYCHKNGCKEQSQKYLLQSINIFQNIKARSWLKKAKELGEIKI